jgi:hypothetical protein
MNAAHAFGSTEHRMLCMASPKPHLVQLQI